MSQESEKNAMEMNREFVPGAMGERITYLRKSKKLTQAQVAEQLGISAQAVSKWESGLSCPDIMTLVPLSQVLGVTTDELLGVSSELSEHDGDRWMTEPKAPGMTEESSEPGFTEKIDSEADVGTEAGIDVKSEAESPGPDAKKLYPVQTKISGIQEVQNLSISAGTCIATIKIGNEFALETEGYQENEVISEVIDKTWSVRDVAEKKRMFADRNSFRKRKMVVTVPEDYLFDFVKIGIGAGTVTGEGLRAKESTLNVGNGQMTMKDFCSGASKITCGMGEITVRGELSGKCSVDCGMGSVRLFIREPGHYGYSTSLGMGEVRIGDNRLSGIGGNQTLNAGDPNFYRISCSMGNVRVAFDQ